MLVRVYIYCNWQLLKPVMQVTPGRELAMSEVVARLPGYP